MALELTQEVSCTVWYALLLPMLDASIQEPFEIKYHVVLGIIGCPCYRLQALSNNHPKGTFV